MIDPPPGWRLRRYEALDSTSSLCRQLAEAGEPERLAIVARRQSAGRGTQGRSWVSPPGNLFLSVLLRPTEPARAVAQWSLLGAVALAEAVADFAPSVRLKWPNDLMVDGAKLAGILSESALDAEGRLAWLVVGFGVNVATAPDVPGRLTTSLGDVIDADALVAPILRNLDRLRLARLRDGFGPIRAAWLARAPELGTHLTIRAGGRPVVGGAFAGLDDDGQLLLSAGGRVRAFAVGEIA